jgi:hypothetical protein
MKGSKTWLWLLFFGSLWGINEVVVGETLFRNEVLLGSVWLSAWAFFILAAARGIVNKPGTSALIAGIAALFRLANAPPFFCHFLAIFLLGVGFDVAASFLSKEGRKPALRHGLSGVLGAYGGYSLFSLIITYIIRYEYWGAGGAAKVLNYILVAGSLAAAVAAFLAPLGYKIGAYGWPVIEGHSRWASIGAAAGLVILWALGWMAD